MSSSMTLASKIWIWKLGEVRGETRILDPFIPILIRFQFISTNTFLRPTPCYAQVNKLNKKTCPHGAYILMERE